MRTATTVTLAGALIAVAAAGVVSMGKSGGERDVHIDITWDKTAAQVGWELNNAPHSQRIDGVQFHTSGRAHPGTRVRAFARAIPDVQQIDCAVTVDGIRHEDKGTGSCSIELFV